MSLEHSVCGGQKLLVREQVAAVQGRFMLAFACRMLPVPTLACFRGVTPSFCHVHNGSDLVRRREAQQISVSVMSPAALAPPIVIRRRRTCTRRGSRTSPAFVRPPPAFVFSLPRVFGGCPPPGALPRRGGGRERGEVAGGAWCGGSGGGAEAGAERPPRPLGRRSRRAAHADFKKVEAAGPVAHGNPRVQR